MEYIEVSPLPEVCQNCEDRRKCLEEDGCEWCCDECDYLGARFVPAPQGDLQGRTTLSARSLNPAPQHVGADEGIGLCKPLSGASRQLPRRGEPVCCGGDTIYII